MLKPPAKRHVSTFKGNRPPDWRWQLARELKSEGINPDKPNYKVKGPKGKTVAINIDPVVARIMKYLKVKVDDGLPSRMWSVHDSTLYEMDEIHTTQDQKRWAIEALIVAGEDQQKIADYLALPLDAIQIFESVFFDVRELAGSMGYFHHTLLQGLATSEIAKEDRDRFWKLVAVYGGIDAVYAWWDMGTSHEAWGTWLEKAAAFQGKKNVYAAQTSYDVNRFSNRFVIENSIKSQLVEIAKTQAGLGNSTGQAVDATMLAQLDFAMAGMVNTKEPLPQVEPRASDQVKQRLAMITMGKGDAKQLPPPQEHK